MSDELVQQYKKFRGITNGAHAISRHLAVVSLEAWDRLFLTAERAMATPLFGINIPDVHVIRVIDIQNIDAADVICKIQSNQDYR